MLIFRKKDREFEFSLFGLMPLGKTQNRQDGLVILNLKYMKTHYFSNPSYLKIDGKPVVFVYLTRVYFRNQGDKALAGLRKLSRKSISSEMTSSLAATKMIPKKATSSAK